MKRVLSHDPVTGITEVFHDTEDGFQIETIQNVTEIIDTNKVQSNHVPYKSKSQDGEYWRAARIPNVVQMEWLTKFGIDCYNPDHADAVKKLLNSNEYMHLKCAPITL